MAPTQLIEVKDLPPEVQGPSGVAAPVGAGTSLGEAPLGLSDASHLGDPDRAAHAPNSAPPLDTWISPSAMPWEADLEQEALALLKSGRTDVWDALTRRFETSLIQAALATTRGRRIEAALKLGIGRNTITRKIQELGLEEG